MSKKKIKARSYTENEIMIISLEARTESKKEYEKRINTILESIYESNRLKVYIALDDKNRIVDKDINLERLIKNNPFKKYRFLNGLFRITEVEDERNKETKH